MLVMIIKILISVLNNNGIAIPAEAEQNVEGGSAQSGQGRPAPPEQTNAAPAKSQSPKTLPHGWTLVERKNSPQKEKPAVDQNSHKPEFSLVPGPWSVPIRTPAELPNSVAGVALVKDAGEAQELMTGCAHLKAPLAIVCFHKLEPGTPLLIQVKNSKGHMVVKRAYMVHLGTSQTKVQYQLASKRVQVTSQTVVVHLCCIKPEMCSKVWEEQVVKRPSRLRGNGSTRTCKWKLWMPTTQSGQGHNRTLYK